MARTADQRINKYGAKIDATVASTRITALKSSMIQSETVQIGALVQMENTVKGYLEAQPSVTSPTMIPFYLAYARQLYAKSRKYSGTLLTNEASAFAQVWFGRGFTASVLVGIASLFGVTIVTPS